MRRETNRHSAARGGSGKTTTAVTLAHGLALAGRRVLLVDCDPRRDAALHFGLAPEPGLAAWLRNRPARALEVRAGLRVLDSGGAALEEFDTYWARTRARNTVCGARSTASRTRTS